MGYGSVAACQEAIGSDEFAEWIAYDSLEPILPPWHVYFGTIAASVTNTMRGKKSDKVWTWQDFYPDPYDTKNGQSIEEQISIVEMLNEAFNGVDLRKNKQATSA